MRGGRSLGTSKQLKGIRAFIRSGDDAVARVRRAMGCTARTASRFVAMLTLIERYQLDGAGVTDSLWTTMMQDEAFTPLLDVKSARRMVGTLARLYRAEQRRRPGPAPRAVRATPNAKGQEDQTRAAAHGCVAAAMLDSAAVAAQVVPAPGSVRYAHLQTIAGIAHQLAGYLESGGGAAGLWPIASLGLQLSVEECGPGWVTRDSGVGIVPVISLEQTLGSWWIPEDVRRLRAHTPGSRVEVLLEREASLVADVVPMFWHWLRNIVADAEEATGLRLMPAEAWKQALLDAQLPKDGLAAPFFGSLVYLATKRHFARLGIPGHGELPHGEPTPLAMYPSSGRYVLIRPYYPPVANRDAMSEVYTPPGRADPARRTVIITKKLGMPIDPDLPWAHSDEEPGGSITFTGARSDPSQHASIVAVHQQLARLYQDDPRTAALCEHYAAIYGLRAEAAALLAAFRPEDAKQGSCDTCPE